MATKIEILKAMEQIEKSTGRSEIRGDEIGIILEATSEQFYTQMSRLVKEGKVTKDDNNKAFSLTPAGHDYLKQFSSNWPLTETKRGREVFTILESDIASLADVSFNDLWALLGIVLRNRFRRTPPNLGGE